MSPFDPQGPALVILAGGASRRLGTCKALVDLGGGFEDTPLRRLLEAASALGDACPLVVTGKHHLEIQRRSPAALQVLHNRDWAEGRTGSVAMAAAARPGRDLLIAPVDVPRVPASVFASLASAWEEAGRPAQGWLAPFCDCPVVSPEDARTKHAQAEPREAEMERRFGHPVLLGRDLAADLARRMGPRPQEGGGGTGKNVRAPEAWRSRPLHKWREDAKPLLSVAVCAPQILENLNTPEDLARIRTRP